MKKNVGDLVVDLRKNNQAPKLSIPEKTDKTDIPLFISEETIHRVIHKGRP